MKKHKLYCIHFSIIFQLVIASFANSQSQEISGTISGKVADFDTKLPLVGVNISVMNTVYGTTTDGQGYYVIPRLPVGHYTIQFSYIGYKTERKTDIIIRPNRTTYVTVELQSSPIEMEAITVNSGYFVKVEDQATSVVNFSNEEIRRAPGTAGDVSRIVMALPSISKINDQANNLIVRGGSPIENAFYIDNMEIPNINHWPTQGSSGGYIGLLNVDFIQDVNFYSGGFPVIYGDKLSSIMDISFREGNRSEFDAQLDLNFAGFGGIAEGPLVKDKASWLISARRSFLDLLVKFVDLGNSIAPRFGDIQGKLVYDLTPNHKLTVLGIFGDAHARSNSDVAAENDMVYYGDQDIYENTTGINWRALWGQKGYSNTSFAFTATKFKEDFFETGSNIQLLKNRSHEKVFKFRNINTAIFNKKISMDLGVDAKYYHMKYDNIYNEYANVMGQTIEGIHLKDQITAYKFGPFVNLTLKPSLRFKAIFGLRSDFYSLNRNHSISSTLAMKYNLTATTAIKGAAGLFHQNLPMILLSQNEKNKNLKDPNAVHYVLGLEHILTKDTRFTVEVYLKDYQNFPFDPNQPDLFLIDEILYQFGFFTQHTSLQDQGKARSEGIELILQKKLAKNIYGIASAALFRSRYQSLDGTWRNRIFDNRLLIAIEGGYKPNNQWEFSLRWIYAGGLPYTPFDMEKSIAQNHGVFDSNRINDARYPDYHSLNIRFDKRFHFHSSNLIFYLSLWNAYNRKNVAMYYWNKVDKKQDAVYQWLLMPILGLEYEL